ncbi:exported hypothetical protein [Pseudoclavibacter sp. 8L]|nr:exported hypothetical protein [Pseudoclavibacter sp. 8L]
MPRSRAAARSPGGSRSSSKLAASASSGRPTSSRSWKPSASWTRTWSAATGAAAPGCGRRAERRHPQRQQCPGCRVDDLAVGALLMTWVSWRWGESNPRPQLRNRGFSGCSLSTVLLGSDHGDRHLDRRAQFQCKSRGALKHNTTASSLNDASYRSGNSPGLTDYRTRLSSEGEVGALSVSTYVLRGAFTR